MKILILALISLILGAIIFLIGWYIIHLLRDKVAIRSISKNSKTYLVIGYLIFSYLIYFVISFAHSLLPGGQDPCREYLKKMESELDLKTIFSNQGYELNDGSGSVWRSGKIVRISFTFQGVKLPHSIPAELDKYIKANPPEDISDRVLIEFQTREDGYPDVFYEKFYYPWRLFF